MSVTNTIFHTATVEQRVPGPAADLSALAYNLQYTKSRVHDLVQANLPRRTDLQTVRLPGRELIRANFHGVDPDDESRQLCAIGIGDSEATAERAARGAWFDFHASVLFTDILDADESYKLTLRHRVPGMPVQRAATIGVGYELPYMTPLVAAAVERNMPTNDEVHVVQTGELTLMCVNLFGRHPLDSSRTVGVGGVADRHYRAMAAAEQAWSDFHHSLLFSAQALGTA